MSILQNINARLTRYAAEQQAVRSYPFDFDGMFTMPNGQAWPLGLNMTMPNSKAEEPDGSFESLVRFAYLNNGIVFACMEARRRLFAQGRFQFQRVRAGTPGDLFGTGALDILEHPEAGKTTGDLLGRMLQDADLAGNSYTTIRNGSIKRLRPDWVTIVLGSDRDPSVVAGDIDAEVLGYIFHPGGRHMGRDPVALLPEEVAHFAPTQDPLASYRGMSWLTPIIREIMGDSAANTHKLKFFENAATPNMVVTLGDGIKTSDTFQQWVDTFEKAHRGHLNAYKTLYLAAGATANPVGANFHEMEFKVTQGAGETRIAAAAGVPPIIVGLSEGLAAATYSNYGQARRAFSDGTMWDLWANVAGSLESLVRPPSGSRLWVDTRHVPFLLEDKKDAAEVQQMRANSIRVLLDAGFESDAVIDAVTSGDLDRLTGKHTGLFSVQLQAPGSTKMPAGEVPGEVPVQGGTKPEVIPAGDTSTKPLAGSVKPAIPGKLAPRSAAAILEPLLAEAMR